MYLVKRSFFRISVFVVDVFSVEGDRICDVASYIASTEVSQFTRKYGNKLEHFALKIQMKNIFCAKSH